MPDSVAAGLRLAPEELTRPFAPEQFAFDTTDDLEPFRGVLGQERAVEALQFGVAMPRPGYNVFVMGEPGTGRFSFVKRYLQAEGKRVATPSDWVYLNNFDEPREPRVIELPPGSATEFSADIDRLIDNLMSTFPAVFEHPAYQQKKNAVDRAFNQRYDRALDSVERRALEKDVALYRDSANVAFTPMKDGKALDEAEFAQLPEAERERFHKDIAALEEYLNEELASLPQWKRESSNQLRELNEETITLALQPLLAPLVEKYNNNPGVCAYLQAMQLNLLKTVVDQLVDDSRTDAQRRRTTAACRRLPVSPGILSGAWAKPEQSGQGPVPSSLAGSIPARCTYLSTDFLDKNRRPLRYTRRPISPCTYTQETMERFFENAMYASRWLLAPIYMGLSLALLALTIKFFQEIFHVIPNIFAMAEADLILVLLSLIDMALVGGLLVMVMISGYENFVSQLDIDEGKEKLNWLGKMDSGSLKNKVAASIVAISSIHLLRIFMDAKNVPDNKLMWYVIIHMTFVLSAFAMGYLDKQTRH